MKLSSNDGLDKTLSEFADVFDEKMSEIPNYRGHIELIEGTQLIYVKSRRIPYAILGKVEEEVKRLENLKIITKIDNSEWDTPIVPVI